MKFSIIIPNVTKNESKLKLLDNCLASFFLHHSNSEFLQEVIVVDDGSDQVFVPRIIDMCSKYGAKNILKDKNEGFSKAVNTGIRASSGDAVILVNNDLSFSKEVLSFFDRDFKDESVGVIGGLLFYPNGTIQHGGIARLGTGFTHIGWHKTYDRAPEVQRKRFLIGVTGAIFGISKKAIDKIGLFDESFFLASEDTQYCLRCWQNDMKVLYDPDIVATHIEGGTRGASDTEKMTQSIDTRNWYIQEMKTKTIFLNWLKKVDLIDIDRKVMSASYKQTEIRQSASSQVSSEWIGIRRSGALGDVIMATPIVRALKKKYPKSKIMFATQCPDAIRGNPYIDEITSSLDILMSRTDCIYDLDLAYENRPKMNIVDAYSDVVFGHPSEDKRMDLQSGEIDFAMAHAQAAGQINFERDKVVVLHQAVSWANRTWPIQYWEHVVRHFTSKGFKIVNVGRGGDHKSSPMAGVVNLIDKLSIPQVREIIKRAKVFVGVDSGILHVAQTTNTPIVGIFTVANPDYRITRLENFFSMVPKSSCRFCLHEEKPPVTFVGCKIGTMQCIKEITPIDVISCIEKNVLGAS